VLACHGAAVNTQARPDATGDLGLEALADRDLLSRITQLASTILDCPIALLSIVDRDREWVLGRTGIDVADCQIAASLCAIWAHGNAPPIIADARDHPLLRDHPLVSGAPFIRACLGVPVRGENGSALGALCAVSGEPRAFRHAQIAPLEMLAELAEQSIALNVRTRELSRANAALQESSQIFRQAEKATNIGSWRVDGSTGQLHWSEQVYAITGLAADRLVSVSDAVQLYHPEDRVLITAALQATLAEGKPFSFETTIRRRDGERRRIRLEGERLDVDGRPDCVAGIIQDCTEEHLRNVALKRAAERDRLTGLYNRASFDRRLAAAMARPDTEAVIVALLDLDGFKDVNDTLGHLVGDRMLVSIAAHLRQQLPAGVFLARWGGDEFALLFPAAMTLADVTGLLQRLVADLSDVIPPGSAAPAIGATCGVAQMAASGSGEEIMRRADLALYCGKDAGRGSVVCWDSQIEARQNERQRAIVRLRGALNEGRALAAFQPIVALGSNTVVGVEALLRLRDVDGTLLAASEVFSALLDPDLSRRVSRVMLDQVVADGPAILAQFGPDCRIALNLSEADLRKGDFVRHLIDVIDDSPLSPANLTIEVTETMLLDAGGHMRASLSMLDDCGFAICLDDFGTGFSSLTHLRRFPIHMVKIDRDFIAGIGEDHQSRLIIQAIVQMGHSLGLKVVVEGVETGEQETFLQAIGCRHVQGYRYGQPALASELVNRFRAQLAAPPDAALLRRSA
jgi:diguanylate cyclase (GGDEF)-like protein/PAS domain S-box-containing protein